MASFILEHPQFLDSVTALPLVNGKIYIGSKGNAPKTNLITIFSDRELTIPLDNPQTINAFGQSANKIWIPAQYSMQVDNSNDVQKFQDLDAGETAESGVTTLSNVQGTNTITAEASTTITEYADKELYTWTVPTTNTGAMTLNINSVDAGAVVKNNGQAMLPGDAFAGQNMIVSRNNTNSNFEWVNQNNQVVDFYKGTAVVSATTIDIWATDGNTIHVTGSTGPISSFGTAPNIGAVKWVIFDSTPTLTNSANLNLQGSANFTAAAGDLVRVYADTTTQLDVTVFKADGSVVGISGTKAWAYISESSGTYTLETPNQNVSGIVDNGTGDVTVSWDTDFSSANYSVVAVSRDEPAANARSPGFQSVLAGSAQFYMLTSAGAATDAAFSIAAFGDNA